MGLPDDEGVPGPSTSRLQLDPSNLWQPSDACGFPRGSHDDSKPLKRGPITGTLHNVL